MKNIEAKVYTYDEVLKRVEGLVRAAHGSLALEEKRAGKRFYETFGEWRKANPLNPVASRNYPEDEYVMVISAYIKYFDTLAASTNSNDIDL